MTNKADIEWIIEDINLDYRLALHHDTFDKTRQEVLVNRIFDAIKLIEEMSPFKLVLYRYRAKARLQNMFLEIHNTQTK